MLLQSRQRPSPFFSGGLVALPRSGFGYGAADPCWSGLEAKSGAIPILRFSLRRYGPVLLSVGRAGHWALFCNGRVRDIYPLLLCSRFVRLRPAE